MRMKVGHPFIFAITILSGVLLRIVAADLLTYFIVTLFLALFGSFCLTILDQAEEVAL